MLKSNLVLQSSSCLKSVFVVIALVFSIASLGPNATAQQSSSAVFNPVNGRNISAAHYSGGRFEQISDRLWQEYQNGNTATYSFNEVGRDSNSVRLRNDSLNVDIEINTSRQMISGAWPGSPRRDLHRITHMENEAMVPGPSTPTTQPPLPPTNQIVDSSTVRLVEYAGGRFEANGPGAASWVEFTDRGSRFNFRNLGHDARARYLYDSSRDTFIVIDVRSRTIRFGTGDRLKDLYAITNMAVAPVSIVGTPPSLPPVNPPVTPPAGNPDGFGKKLSVEDRLRCLVSGGKVEVAGILGAERCTLSYRDGGQVCTDSSQCEGDCRAPINANDQNSASGTCQMNDNPFGCYASVENSQTGPALCVD